MKKTLLISAIVVLALGALGVGIAFAQSGRPPYGSMMGGYGYGRMHEYVEKTLVAKLGLTEEQVEEAFAAGKPMYQIALDNGIAQDELADFMKGVHQDAIAQAVKDGAITQEQADWMFQRMQNMYQNSYGFGNCPMYNGQGAPFNRGQGPGPGMMRNWGGLNP